MFVLARLASGRVRTKKWLAIAPIAPIVLVACGSGRNYDNPPEVAPITSGSSSTTAATSPTTTVFVPTTAPTTLGPVTAPPTAPPPPTPPPTPRPTEATVPTTPVVTTGETYTVVGGDTLYGISRKLGVTLDKLLGANGLNETSLITPGQTLQIPEGGSVPATNPATDPPATNAPDPTGAPDPTSGTPGPTAPPETQPPATPPGGTQPGSRPTTTFAPPAGAVQPTGASATCQDDDSEEANGTPIVFSPSNVLDHNPATAWRCPNPVTGETLTVTLDAETTLTSVGMIGGYVKADPLTGVDRFLQNHRVRRVRWTFSDGTFVEQDLADSREMQTLTLPEPVTTSTVTIEILSTYPSSGPSPMNKTVIAEVQLIG